MSKTGKMRAAGWLMAGVMALSLMSGCKAEAKSIAMEAYMVENATVFRQQGADFSKGHLTDAKAENGGVVLAGGKLEGEWLSPEIEANAFTSFVGSWNTDTTEQNSVEIQFQVRVDGSWSKWMSAGLWTRADTRGSVSATYDLAQVDVDTVTVSDKKSADALRCKALLRRDSADSDSPRLRRVSCDMTFCETPEATWTLNGDAYQKVLDVPVHSQMIVPKIGDQICSATSVSMVMGYYGVDLAPADVAWGARDYGAELFGNWSFNMAFAGEQGFCSYVESGASFDKMKWYIENDMPVVLSIKTGGAVHIKGAPMDYNYGHLLVLVGFTEKNGTLYAVVNDPAAPADSKVRREYQADQLEKAWIGINYVITPEVQD